MALISMTSKHSFWISFLLLFCAGIAYGQRVEFLKKTETGTPPMTLAAHRSDGYVVVGTFKGQLQIGDNLLDRNDPTNTYYYLAKYDSTGTPLWAESIGGKVDSFLCTNVSLDSFGNIYVGGTFINRALFGDSLARSSSYRVFLAKFDPLGNYRWLRMLEGNISTLGVQSWMFTIPSPSPPPPIFYLNVGRDYNRLLGVDSLENVYFSFVGKYAINIDTIAVFGSSTTISNYVAKLSPRGRALWGRGFSSSDTFNIAQYSVRYSGESFILGSTAMHDKIGLGIFAPSPIGGRDLILIKLDAKGRTLWARSYGSTGEDSACSIGYDARGNIYITGIFGKDFTVGGKTLKATGTMNYFLMKLDPSGNPVWAKSWSTGGAVTTSTELLLPNYINVDRYGDVYSVTNFTTSITYDSVTYAAKGNNDLFLFKCNTDGKTYWKMAAGSPGNELCYDLAINGYGDAYLTGVFDNTFTFGNFTLTGGNKTGFIAKIAQPTIITDSLTVRHCTGDSITVNYHTDGVSAPFVVQVSDSGGVFNPAVNLGTFSPQANVGTLRVKLPMLQYGEHYAIRLIGTPVDSIGLRSGPAFGIDSLPTVTILHTKELTFCEGGSTGLIAQGGNYAYWSTGDSTRRIDVSKSGVYKVAVVNAFGCERVDSVRVTVVPLPKIAIKLNKQTTDSVIRFCDGDSIRITATGAKYYYWSTKDTNEAITIHSSGIYSVSGSDTNNCFGSAQVQVIVNPAPTKPVITQSGSVLTSNSATGDQWYKDGKMISGATAMTYDATGKPGSYQVLIHDSNGCTAISEAVQIADTRSVHTQASVSSVGVYPNPYKNYFDLAVNLDQSEFVSIDLYDVLGHRIAEIYQGTLGKGGHTIHYSPESTEKQLYVRVQIGENIRTYQVTQQR